jgi:hypothetical protein
MALMSSARVWLFDLATCSFASDLAARRFESNREYPIHASNAIIAKPRAIRSRRSFMSFLARFWSSLIQFTLQSVTDNDAPGTLQSLLGCDAFSAFVLQCPENIGDFGPQPGNLLFEFLDLVAHGFLVHGPAAFDLFEDEDDKVDDESEPAADAGELPDCANDLGVHTESPP